MSSISLQAETRADVGKGASRRLRRLENKVPAVIYGGDKAPQSIHFAHNQLIKALEDERIYASVIDIKVNKTVEQVILKDLQRHPYKPIIMHLDLQRVSAKDVLVKQIPVHFTNEEISLGVKAGGILNHTLTQIEVRCQVKDLPPFIEVDVAKLDLNEVIHLSQVKLPKNVALAAEITDQAHDFPVVSIHLPKVIQEVEEEVEAEEADAEETEGETKAAAAPEATEGHAEENKQDE
jgi:large subunit ribosomal protein L25